MSPLAATQAYQREGAGTWEDGTSCLISDEIAGDGNLPPTIILDRADLQCPADSRWSEDSGAALGHSRLPVYSLLGQLYGFELSPDVSAFLEQNPALIPVLFDAWQVVDRCLEPHPRIELRLRRDPEVEALTMLFAIVHTASDPQQAFFGLKALDAGWLFLKSAWVRELFNVDVEFD